MSLDADLTRLRLISEAKAGGASWAAIGRTLGKDPKVAKRDAKRLAKKTSRAAWQQENTSREAVLQDRRVIVTPVRQGDTVDNVGHTPLTAPGASGAVAMSGHGGCDYR